ncbi:CD99 molecule isoform X2 [Notolabrus celidotus]|uniref:CD99 molecule isoform X2 n=1 Tax=Notolabrus celidotus TaxID=1203425 RepID=UPI0014904FDA|nr:CD99 molecule isoform X2 [Notolabrus celidotus]
MKSGLRIALLLCLVSGTLTQDGFDLSDALFDEEPTPPKPKDTPKVPDVPGKPKDDGLDLLDAFDFGPTPAKPKPPKTPEKPKDDGGFGLDLEDALGPDPNPKPDKPAVKPQPGGGGGSFDDSDLFDVNGGGGYKPDGGPAYDPGYDPNGGADQTQEAGAGPIAGIVSAVGVALLGAASSYFAYQKKKLCFKIQGGQDPEMGKGQRSPRNDNQIFSSLLKTS